CRRKSGGSRPALRGCRCCCRRHGRARAARCARPLIRPPGTFSRKREKGWNRTGSADPVRSTGRAGGGCFLCARFLCTSKEKVARAVTARKPLILMSGEPEQLAGQDPPYGAAVAVAGDTEEQEQLAALAPSSALRAPSPASGRRAGTAPAPRTRCAAPGAQAGGAFFAPGFFAQAKIGGSRRHGAKALDLDVGERAAGQDPPYGA